MGARKGTENDAVPGATGAPSEDKESERGAGGWRMEGTTVGEPMAEGSCAELGPSANEEVEPGEGAASEDRGTDCWLRGIASSVKGTEVGGGTCVETGVRAASGSSDGDDRVGCSLPRSRLLKPFASATGPEDRPLVVGSAAGGWKLGTPKGKCVVRGEGALGSEATRGGRVKSVRISVRA